MKKKVPLQTKQDLKNAMEMVAERVVDNTLTTKQGDVVNTSVKNVLAVEKLQLQYLVQIRELYKGEVREGRMEPEDILKKVPRFFGATGKQLPEK